MGPIQIIMPVQAKDLNGGYGITTILTKETV